MMYTLATGLLLTLAASTPVRPIDLPPRPLGAPGGTEFARSISALPLKEREERIVAALTQGNVPTFLRSFVPVTVAAGPLSATFEVAPDYLAVGSDDDYFLAPLTPSSAQAVADRLGCTLPTPRMVDEIYASAKVKLTPSPIPPSPEMTTVPVFLRHNAVVLAQRKEFPPGMLVAGHKKDVVISNRVFLTRGKVAIYGWHTAPGKPIQPLYTGHGDSWVDYSHGVRLVRRQMTVNGQTRTIDEVLADRALAPLLSDEGVMARSRYDLKEPAIERPEVLRLDHGVRVMIDRPATDHSKPLVLILYALPNGSTIEQTIGKTLKPGDDWHFDIQHIAAQLRFLRETVKDRALAVAYAENDLKSWPAWRNKHGDAGIPAIIDAVRARFKGSPVRTVLAGHSGGGSFIFGFLNETKAIPDDVERIAFLDANYAYETSRHRDKLVDWLKASDRHYLVVLAYNDAVVTLNGKPIVTAAGGTWGRSHVMQGDLEGSLTFVNDLTSDPQRFSALDGRVTLWLKENPDRKIFHTVQVERNGFVECLLSGTPLQGVGYHYLGDRAYSAFIRDDPTP
jgi:hypothetical protein